MIDDWRSAKPAHDEVPMAKQKRSESGRHRGERKSHDAAVHRQQQETIGRPWHASDPVRITAIVVMVVVILGITAMFVGGVIHW